MTTIYSIGHSRHGAEHFLRILRAQEVALLVDVRWHPASKWVPQFGKAALSQTLAKHAIEYLFLGLELGGRPNGAGQASRRLRAQDRPQPGRIRPLNLEANTHPSSVFPTPTKRVPRDDRNASPRPIGHALRGRGGKTAARRAARRVRELGHKRLGRKRADAVPAVVTLGEKAKRGAEMGEGVHEGLEPRRAASV